MSTSSFITTHQAGGVITSSLSPLSSATVRCHNLRFVTLPTGETVLRPVGRPSSFISGAWKPMIEITPFDGRRRLIVVSGLRVGQIMLDLPRDAYYPEPVAPEVIEFDTLENKAICAVDEGSQLVIMTSRGPVCWTLADDGSWLRVDPLSWPALSLTAVEGADCRSVVPSRRLSAAYDASSVGLSDADRRAVTDDLRRAYCDMASQALASGALCAPVVMRYRLVGHYNDILFESPPLILGASDPDRMSRPLSVASADRRVLSSFSVAARTWRPKLSSAPIPEAMAKSVSRIEIVATPQFHPFDPVGDASMTLVATPGSDEMLRVTMPGAALAMSSVNGVAAESRLRRILGDLDSLERIIAVIHGPFDNDETLDITPSLIGLYRFVSDECKAVEKAVAAPPAAAPDTALAAVSAPNSFTASCVASAAGRTLWADIAPLRFDGFKAESFAAERAGQGAWHAAVAVAFASGDEQVVALSSGDSGAPIKFNPLLSYPSPDAVSMTLIVSASGVVRRATLPLSPDTSGLRSVYVSPGFAPFVLPDTDAVFAPPPVRRLVRPMPSFMVMSAPRAPVTPLAVSTVGGGSVSGVFVASRALSSWDFTRPRFVALSSVGSFAVTLSSARGPTLSVSRIDSRPVAPGAACLVDGRLLAVADDSLVEVGVSGVRTLIASFSADYMAFDPVRRELWATSSLSSATTVVDPDSLVCYTRDDMLSSPPVGRYVLIGDRLCVLGDETSPDSAYIRWDGEMRLGPKFVVLRDFTLDMRASAFSYGSLTLRRVAPPDAEPSPSLRLSLNGALKAPVRLTVAAPGLRRVAFSLQGRVSADAVISSVSLTALTLSGYEN